MTEQSYDGASEFEQLPDNAIVYRALLRKQWVDWETGEIKFSAYLLRQNEQSLSVNIASACTPQQSAARFRNCYGVASLQVGRIRELDLDVVPDSTSHANIVGLPNMQENPATARRLADLLARQSQIVWRP
ncbi:hypothetical protein IQ264_17990 [Phormidium sp. LEGE 05292]|uniref:hypothetical protein n=1 Tax=[Phormidium] sp. LEGE 05292 TaxID=767427 RepID=UPI001882A6D4|nr:hypothetical protein [Phormidium sp. LEGE 05292]MBE9227321.1 hypothetical protein [Phormidium sp. LEGE 05292]